LGSLASSQSDGWGGHGPPGPPYSYAYAIGILMMKYRWVTEISFEQSETSVLIIVR
jgi:hypothetical protein